MRCAPRVAPGAALRSRRAAARPSSPCPGRRRRACRRRCGAVVVKSRGLTVVDGDHAGLARATDDTGGQRGLDQLGQDRDDGELHRRLRSLGRPSGGSTVTTPRLEIDVRHELVDERQQALDLAVVDDEQILVPPTSIAAIVPHGVPSASRTSQPTRSSSRTSSSLELERLAVDLDRLPCSASASLRVATPSSATSQPRWVSRALRRSCARRHRPRSSRPRRACRSRDRA